MRAAYDISGGLPIYLAEIDRLISRGQAVDHVLGELPPTFAAHMARQWKASESPRRNELLALLLSASPLSIDELAGLVGSGRDIRAELATDPFLVISDDGSVDFRSTTYRQFAASRLENALGSASQKLLEYYGSRSPDDRSLLLLPALLRESRDHAGLERLTSPESIANAVIATRDFSGIRNAVAIAVEASAEEGRVGPTMYGALAAGLLSISSEHVIALEHEVRALSALGDFESAVRRASEAVLPQDQLRCLSLVAARMRESGIAADDVDDAIDVLATQLPKTIPPEEMATIAARVFGARPDTAVRLIEQSAGDDERALDRALALASLHLAHLEPSSASTRSHLRDRIGDPDLRDMVRASAPELARMSADEVLVRAAGVRTISGQLHVLRDWCNANRNNEQAGRVISRAWDLIGSARSHTPGARLRRQLLTPLSAVSVDEARPIVENILGLEEGLPDRPRREKYRIDLMLCEQVARWDPERAAAILNNVLSFVNDEASLDVRAYALLLARRVAGRLPRQFRPNRDFAVEFEASFESMLANSAEHWQAAKHIIRLAAESDLPLAASLAARLNTGARREAALVEAVNLNAASDEPDVVLYAELLRQVANIAEVRGPAVSELVSRLVRSNATLSSDDLEVLRGLVEELTDPSDKAVAHAWLASARKGNADKARDEAERCRSALMTIDDADCPLPLRNDLCRDPRQRTSG